MSVALKNFTRISVPRFLYAKVAQAVLPGWEISLVFVGSARARSLNKALRAKDYIPNVLSYALTTRSGEVVICLPEAARQCRRYGMDERNFVLYLFIHALLHLKGRPHGATMERQEKTLMKTFTTKTTPAQFYGSPHRHRN